MDKGSKPFDMKRCLLGFLGISVVGMLLHNAYAWTKPFLLFALIAPVNESVWEHLKMAYWGVIIWAAIEGLLSRHKIENWVPALAAGTAIFMLTIVVVFYSYTALTGTSVLWVDISTFVVGTFLCRWVSCRIRSLEGSSRLLEVSALIYLVCMAVLFIYFTFHPPGADIFIDHSESRVETIHSFF